MTRVWLAFFTYSKGAPKGLVLDRFDVPMFKKIQLPRGGPAVASPPSFSLSTSWMLRRKPCLRHWKLSNPLFQVFKPQTALGYRHHPPRSLCQTPSWDVCDPHVRPCSMCMVNFTFFLKLLRAPRFEVLFDSVRSTIHKSTLLEHVPSVLTK